MMNHSEWRSIDSAPIGIPVLITDGTIVTGGLLDEFGWDVIGCGGYDVEIIFEPTYWMLRPEPPK